MIIPVCVFQNGGHVLGGGGLHLLVEGLEVHALGLPKVDLHHGPWILALRIQQLGRILA